MNENAERYLPNDVASDSEDDVEINADNIDISNTNMIYHL